MKVAFVFHLSHPAVESVIDDWQEIIITESRCAEILAKHQLLDFRLSLKGANNEGMG